MKTAHLKFVFSPMIFPLLKQSLLAFGSFLVFCGQSNAAGSLGCLGAGVTEYFVPGLGFALVGEYDDAVLLGGSRRILRNQIWQISGGTYSSLPETEMIRASDSQSGKDEYIYTWDQKSQKAATLSRIESGLQNASIYQFYQSRCADQDTDTYHLLNSAIRFDHFYDNWMFWAPVAYEVMNAQGFFGTSDSIKELHLGDGLTRNEALLGSFTNNIFVGAGEEMAFRGALQHYFFDSFQEMGFSPQASRHSSILTAAIIFGSVHPTGQKGSATLAGIYNGYTYHPSIHEFDLTTAIAVHSWSNFLNFYYAFVHRAKVTETNNKIQYPLLHVGFNF